MIQAGIEKFFKAWGREDGPWWEADVVLGIYRHLKKQAFARGVRLTPGERSALIPFLNTGWDSVTTPRIGAENHVRPVSRSAGARTVLPLNSSAITPQRVRQNGLYPDLYYRTATGGGFEWLVEVKLWSENHRRLAFSMKKALVDPLDVDLSRWRRAGHATAKIHLVGCLAMSPKCFQGPNGHCGDSFDAFVSQSEQLLRFRSGDPAAYWHIGLKWRDGQSHRAVYLVAHAGRVHARWRR